MTEVFDVTIIGGGAAGMYSSFYAGLRGMKTKLIEFQSSLGGKVQLFPEKKIWDIGGQPPITGDAFIKQQIEQALTFKPTIELNTKVLKLVEVGPQNFEIHTTNGIHYSKSIIVAVGGGIINPQKLQVEGVEKEDIKNLHYVVRQFEKFRDQTVLISGGGNTAIDWANELRGIAKEIHLIYRGEKLSAHEAQVAFLHEHAKVSLNTSIQKVIADVETNCVKEVSLHCDNSEQTIAVDHIIVSHGFDMDQSIEYDFSQELEVIDGRCIKAQSSATTTVPGIFAAGDISSYEGKVNLLVGCFQDAVNAVNQAKIYIEPTADKYAMVSSHNDRVQKSYILSK